MKTKNKAHNANSYVFKAAEPILVDANVWLYLQPPAAQPAPPWALAYSNVYARLLKAGARPVIDALILSEYLNRYVRLEYDANWKTAYPRFKDFRQSANGIGVLSAAVADVSCIVKTTTLHDTPLCSIDVPAVLDAVKCGTLDFNDGLLIQSCRLNGLKLLTNDSDVAMGGIEVLTVNKKLLQSCP